MAWLPVSHLLSNAQSSQDSLWIHHNPDQDKAVTGLKEILTHTSFFEVLFRSLPYSLADMKWSLKAGMSLSVARQPRPDMQQLMMRGRTGTGDMMETPIYRNEPIADGQVWTPPCQLELNYLSVTAQTQTHNILMLLCVIFLQLLFVRATLFSCCFATSKCRTHHPSDQWMTARANFASCLNL